jgi:hypothetical protein
MKTFQHQRLCLLEEYHSQLCRTVYHYLTDNCRLDVSHVPSFIQGHKVLGVTPSILTNSISKFSVAKTPGTASTTAVNGRIILTFFVIVMIKPSILNSISNIG